MGRIYSSIDGQLGEWLSRQPVFFVATAPLGAGGHVNCSPKGNRGEFVLLDDHGVAYLDQTGSGVETIAHLNENGRIVIMFCAFSGPPRIVRVHGTGRVVLTTDEEFEALRTRLGGSRGVGDRSIVVVDVTRVSDSCGYGVPLMPFQEHRPTMDEWAERKGPDGIQAYWSDKNSKSVDGLPGLGG
jgi:hypothetical protein